MKEAVATRNHWANLLSNSGPMNATPFAEWLRLATSMMATDAAGSGPDRSMGRAGPFVPGEAGTVDWAELMKPWMSAFAAITDNLQGSAFSWVKPAAAESPMARLLSHPAAVVGGENSNTQLSAHAVLAYVDFVQSAMSHQALQMQGWLTAMQQFAAEFIPTGDGQSPAVVIKTLDDLVAHWGTIGEAALQKHSRTDRFLQSQAELLRKDMRYRIARRRVTEAAARASDLPTLTDLDEALASIHDLRKELRAVRQLAESAAAKMAATASAPSSKAEPKTKQASAAHRMRRAA